MEILPIPHAAARTKTIAAIMMQEMVENKTLQLSDLRDLYNELSDLESSVLTERATLSTIPIDELSPEHKTALNLRLNQVITGTDPFADDLAT